MDEFLKTGFRRRASERPHLPEVSVERLAARAKAADRYKAQVPREQRQCECCRWKPPAPLLAGNKQLFLLHAHHIISVSRGGSDNPENLVLLCANCHAIADYLGGRNAVPDPIRTREELMGHLLLLTTDPEAWATQYHPVAPGTEWENVLQELAQSAQEPSGASAPPVVPASVSAPTVAQMPDPGPLTEEAGQ